MFLLAWEFIYLLIETDVELIFEIWKWYFLINFFFDFDENPSAKDECIKWTKFFYYYSITIPLSISDTLLNVHHEMNQWQHSE